MLYIAYTGFDPVIEDGNIFRITVKHEFFSSTQKSDTAMGPRDQAEGPRDQADVSQEILNFCITEKSLNDIMLRFGYTNKTKFRNKYMLPLLNQDKLRKTIPSKPNSPNQKYLTVTKKGNNND